MPYQSNSDPEFRRKLDELRSKGVTPVSMEIHPNEIADAICSVKNPPPRDLVMCVLIRMGDWLTALVDLHANNIENGPPGTAYVDALTESAAILFQIAVFRHQQPEQFKIAELIADHVYALAYASRPKDEP